MDQSLPWFGKELTLLPPEERCSERPSLLNLNLVPLEETFALMSEETSSMDLTLLRVPREKLLSGSNLKKSRLIRSATSAKFMNNKYYIKNIFLFRKEVPSEFKTFKSDFWSDSSKNGL